MSKKRIPLKVGFDLDGVLLYNPARLSRPIFEFFRTYFLHRKKVKFHIPRKSLSQFIWYLFHKSSLWIAPGYSDLKKLIREGRVEAYVVSGRYGSLHSDFEMWMRRLQAPKYFRGIYHNQEDEQPYEFKRRMLKELNLDVYVEDNWDILEILLKEKFAQETKLFWLSNPLDWKRHYTYKFRRFREVIRKLKKQTDV